MISVPPAFWLISAVMAVLVAAVVWLLGRQRAHTLLAQQQHELHALQSGIDHARAELAQKHEQYQSLQAQLHAAQNQIQAALTRSASLETENRQIAVLAGELQEARNQIATQNQQLNSAAGQLSAARQQIADWEQRGRQWQEAENQHATVRQSLSHSQMQISALQEKSAAQNDKLAEWEQRAQAWHDAETQHQATQQRLADLQADYRSLNTQLKKEREAYEEKLALLHNAEEELSNRFKNLANEILEEKSRRFSEQNRESLTQLLNPLHEKMQNFSQLVQNTYEKETKERASLESELKRLQQLNTQLHTDAKALTDALVGTQNKNQGNWGEMILEKMLESSGLQKGREYEIQAAATVVDDDGTKRRLQPDVVVHLPENKDIIIDSKMSLTAYVRYTQADDRDTAMQELSAHVRSVRQHMKELSEKRYDSIKSLHSPDYVLMFIPVEPAYLLALQHDQQLFEDCFAKHVVLVGPSTLLATLRTVAGLWRSERQNQNALNIAEAGGKLYDKLAMFAKTLTAVGENIDQAKAAYDKAVKQLSSGRGNAMRQAEKLRRLGVPTQKTLPEALQPEEEDDSESEAAGLSGSLSAPSGNRYLD